MDVEDEKLPVSADQSPTKQLSPSLKHPRSRRKNSLDSDDYDNDPDDAIPDLSQIGGFPRLSSIRLPDFLPRRLLAAAEGYARPRGGLSSFISGSNSDLIPSSTNSNTDAALALNDSETPTKTWPSWTSLLSSSSPTTSFSPPPDASVLSTSVSSMDSFPTFGLRMPQPPTFSFPRHLANYLFSNGDDATDSSEPGYDTEDADLRSDDGVTLSSPNSEARERRRQRARDQRRRARQIQQPAPLDGAVDSGTAAAAAAADVGVNVELSEEKERELRNKILLIQALNISDKERALRMHAVMTEEYYRLRNSQGQRPDTVSSGLNDDEEEFDDEFYDDEEADLTTADKTSTWFDEANGIRGCKHYQRGVKLQCSQCEQWHPCRFCHDEIEASHQLVRYETRNMLCMECLHPQPAAQDCRNCGVRVARYYCDICKLWDDDPDKSIYHCADCGICRIGEGLGRDFFHCKVSLLLKVII